MLFFSPRKSRRVPPSRCRPSAFRPRLEALEDRCLLTAGALDPTFGSGGIATTSTYNGAPLGNVAIQADGKVLATSTPSNSRGIEEAGVTRFNADGSLDTSFGNGGTATAQLTIKLASQSNAVAVQSDGKILIAGATLTGTTPAEAFFLARFNTNGTLDTSFGSGGMVHTNFGGGTDEALSLAVQADGKIVLAGGIVYGSTGQLVRYNSNGTLDNSFGAGGTVSLSASSWNSEFRGVAIQSDGKIVAMGRGSLPSGQEAFGVARFTSSGALDSTFASGGIAVTALTSGSHQEPVAVAIQSDGKIVEAGWADDPTGVSDRDFGLVRYNVGVAGQPDGSLDTTFGQGGIVTTPFPDGGVLGTDAIALQADGKIIVAGSGDVAGTAFFELARYNVGVTGQADGSLDGTFGDGGIVLTSGSGAGGNGVAIYPNSDPTNGGKIVVTGTGNGNNLVFVRYLAAPSPSFSVTGFPSSITAGTAGTFTVTARNADGSTNTSYTGTVHFTSTDPNAVLPADYRFTAADQGVHIFSATLVTTGIASRVQLIQANDTANSTTFGGESGIVVNPAAASKFVVSGFPTSITQGTAATFTVTAEDPYGNVATGYTGTVKFSSSDPLASLPANYTFTAADAGVHTFSATLNTIGTESLTVTDTLDSSITGIDTGITVTRKRGH